MFLYLKDMVNRNLDKSDLLEKIRDEVDDLLDTSVVAEGDLLAYKTQNSITDYHEINLSQLDFESLRKEFPIKEHKQIDFADLRAFMELKLQQMMRQNKSRGKFLERDERYLCV